MSHIFHAGSHAWFAGTAATYATHGLHNIPSSMNRDVMRAVQICCCVPHPIALIGISNQQFMQAGTVLYVSCYWLQLLSAVT
jgi:hypothetical protein